MRTPERVGRGEAFHLFVDFTPDLLLDLTSLRVIDRGGQFGLMLALDLFLDGLEQALVATNRDSKVPHINGQIYPRAEGKTSEAVDTAGWKAASEVTLQFPSDDLTRCR